jgi:hypothetical protein
MPRLEVENKTPQQDLLIFSGYENLISKIDHWTEWMGTIDFTALKTKLLGSIAAGKACGVCPIRNLKADT